MKPSVTTTQPHAKKRPGEWNNSAGGNKYGRDGHHAGAGGGGNHDRGVKRPNNDSHGDRGRGAGDRDR